MSGKRSEQLFLANVALTLMYVAIILLQPINMMTSRGDFVNRKAGGSGARDRPTPCCQSNVKILKGIHDQTGISAISCAGNDCPVVCPRHAIRASLLQKTVQSWEANMNESRSLTIRYTEVGENRQLSG